MRSHCLYLCYCFKWKKRIVFAFYLNSSSCSRIELAKSFSLLFLCTMFVSFNCLWIRYIMHTLPFDIIFHCRRIVCAAAGIVSCIGHCFNLCVFVKPWHDICVLDTYELFPINATIRDEVLLFSFFEFSLQLFRYISLFKSLYKKRCQSKGALSTTTSLSKVKCIICGENLKIRQQLSRTNNLLDYYHLFSVGAELFRHTHIHIQQISIML